MKNTLIRFAALASIFAAIPAHPCAKQVADRASKRVRLWKENTPYLPYNDLLTRLRPGDTVIFGDGTEVELQGKEYGDVERDYGVSFRTAHDVSIWIPFLTANPKQRHQFEADRRRLVSHATDFAKLSHKLSEYSIPRRKIHLAGYENQFFLIAPMPKDAFSFEAFLTPGTIGPEALDARERNRAVIRLQKFFELAAPFKQIGLDDGTRNLYYSSEKGWFLREFTSYNEMVRETDLKAPTCFLLSGEFTQQFFATREGFEAAMAERNARRFPGRAPIYAPVARQIFQQLGVETRIARKGLFGVANEIRWDRPTELGNLLGD